MDVDPVAIPISVEQVNDPVHGRDVGFVHKPGYRLAGDLETIVNDYQR